jgi:hexosaminidase
MEATIDLGKSKTISKVTMDAFHGEESWIYLPKSVEVSVSYDNILYKQVKKLTADEIRQMGSVIEMNLGEQHARYVKVISESAGKIPDGKPGAGHDAWLFVDEIGIY